MRVCVVGAGMVGLSSAVSIQNAFPNSQITIMASQFSPHLTSDIAAGLILPFLAPKDPRKTMQWFKYTMDYCKKQVKNNTDGIQEIVGYFYTPQNESAPMWANDIPLFLKLSDEEVKERNPNPDRNGYYIKTFYIEPTKEIQRMTDQFLSKGGIMLRRTIHHFLEVFGEYDVVINCSGLGARELCNDLNLRPLRGQVVRMNIPSQRYFYVDGHDYALLNDNVIVLGGTADENEWDTTVDQKTAERILRNNFRMVPNLQKGTIISHTVGLRPFRENVRLEIEHIRDAKKSIPVIHNYGHGGSGITLAWGCAQDVVELLRILTTKSNL